MEFAFYVLAVIAVFLTGAIFGFFVGNATASYKFGMQSLGRELSYRSLLKEVVEKASTAVNSAQREARLTKAMAENPGHGGPDGEGH